jgi:hypothetical protein
VVGFGKEEMRVGGGIEATIVDYTGDGVTIALGGN